MSQEDTDLKRKKAKTVIILVVTMVAIYITFILQKW